MAFGLEVLWSGCKNYENNVRNVKAKITCIFSDGFVTTSNFGPCPPVSLPLIASSWYPDPFVAPQVVKSNGEFSDALSAVRCAAALRGDERAESAPALL